MTQILFKINNMNKKINIKSSKKMFCFNKQRNYNINYLIYKTIIKINQK